jgi:Sensors of blue-light using FAD
MHHLVYSSTATQPLSDAQLNELLTQSRERNAIHDITGFLVYHDGAFMQVLEGPEKNVNLIFDSIKRDPRHHNIELIIHEPIRDRNFADWHMAFRRVEDARDMPAGYSTFLNSSFHSAEFENDASLCHQLLLGFKRMLT